MARSTLTSSSRGGLGVGVGLANPNPNPHPHPHLNPNPNPGGTRGSCCSRRRSRPAHPRRRARRPTPSTPPTCTTAPPPSPSRAPAMRSTSCWLRCAGRLEAAPLLGVDRGSAPATRPACLRAPGRAYSPSSAAQGRSEACLGAAQPRHGRAASTVDAAPLDGLLLTGGQASCRTSWPRATTTCSATGR